MTPPLGAVRPDGDQICGRLVGDGYCGAPAVEHVAWTPDMENGLVCADHWLEAQRAWAFFDHHPLTGLCAIQDAGVLWIDSREYPPGYCAQRVEGDVIYIETYETVPAEAVAT